jgi:hypothetical protein
VIGKLIILAIFPGYTVMRVLGVVTHDVLELREELTRRA